VGEHGIADRVAVRRDGRLLPRKLATLLRTNYVVRTLVASAVLHGGVPRQVGAQSQAFVAGSIVALFAHLRGGLTRGHQPSGWTSGRRSDSY